MLVSIQHTLEFSSLPDSPIDLILTPRVDAYQKLHTFDLLTAPDVPLLAYENWQGNRIHRCSIGEWLPRFVVWARSILDVYSRRWRVEELDDSIPMSRVDPRHRDYLAENGPVRFDARLETFAREIGLWKQRDAVTALRMVADGLAILSPPSSGSIGSTLANVSDMLTHGTSCVEDTVHVTLALLRQLGIPSRFVSGYLRRLVPAGTTTHAWVEAFVPSIGWVGVDPWTRQLVDDCYVAVAAGRSLLDVPFYRGVCSSAPVERVETTLTAPGTTKVRKADNGLLMYTRRVPASTRSNVPASGLPEGVETNGSPSNHEWRTTERARASECGQTYGFLGDP